MADSPLVRFATADDARAMASVHVQAWRSTYRGLMPDELLDAPGFVERREAFWTTVLTDPRFEAHTAAVAESAGEIVGIAMTGPSGETDVDVERTLFVLYVLDTHHGSGAGDALLDTVLDRVESAALWVADPNPRAQAFYRKYGFLEDGVHKVEDGVREVRMRRPLP